MKVLKPFCFSLLAVLLFTDVNSRPVIEYFKSGGLFGRFRDVSQSYQGEYSGGDKHWVMLCSGIGWNRCKFQARKTADYPGGAEWDFASEAINDLELHAENEASQGNLNGSKIVKLARSTEGDEQPETLVILTLEWEAIDEEFNDGNMRIYLDEVPYPY